MTLLTPLSSATTFWAASWLFQKSAPPIRVSISLKRAAFLSTSKRVPERLETGKEGADLSGDFVLGHGRLTLSQDLDAEEHHQHQGHSPGQDGGHGNESLAPCLLLFWRRPRGRRIGAPDGVVDHHGARLVGAPPGRGDLREELARERAVHGDQEGGDLLLLRFRPPG